MAGKWTYDALMAVLLSPTVDQRLLSEGRLRWVICHEDWNEITNLRDLQGFLVVSQRRPIPRQDRRSEPTLLGLRVRLATNAVLHIEDVRTHDLP
ncbi:MAG: hypothetical protein ACPGVG_18910 [Mycobacterium sp.]